MTKKRKHTYKMGNARSLLLGTLICAGCFLAFSALFTLAAFFTENPTPLAQPLGLASFVISGAVSGFISAKLKGGEMLIPALSALAFVLLAMIIGLAKEGQNLPVRCLINYLCYMGVSILFAFFGSRKSKRKR